VVEKNSDADAGEDGDNGDGDDTGDEESRPPPEAEIDLKNYFRLLAKSFCSPGTPEATEIGLV
jgi:hypothetical protein